MESANDRLNFEVSPVLNSFYQMDNIEHGEKMLVEFDDIAHEMYKKLNDQTDFHEWKRMNRSHIIRYFEATCLQKNIICQECKGGPMKGNFWICKRVPQEMLNSYPS